jgi:hypothetical protein
MRWLWMAVALTAMAMPARADVSVTISKSEQRMAVSVDGAPPMVWTVSTGRSGYDTPTGSFHAIRLEEVYYSKKFDDAPMPNSVFFYGGYAIHGTLEERRLGSPASHGCVRLARPNAATLFSLVRAHGMSRTRITITEGPLGRGYDAPVARYERGSDRPYERSFAARSVATRYDERATDRGGFQQFENRDRRDVRAPAPQPRVYWNEEPRGRERGLFQSRERLVPGRVYSESEMRRIYRDNGWRF